MNPALPNHGFDNLHLLNQIFLPQAKRIQNGFRILWEIKRRNAVAGKPTGFLKSASVFLSAFTALECPFNGNNLVLLKPEYFKLAADEGSDPTVPKTTELFESKDFRFLREFYPAKSVDRLCKSELSDTREVDHSLPSEGTQLLQAATDLPSIAQESAGYLPVLLGF